MTELAVTEYNTGCKVGDDWIRYIQVLEDDVAVTNYTGWTFFMGIKENLDDDDYMFELELADGITVVTIGEAKFVKTHLTKAQSATVSVTETKRPGIIFPEKIAYYDWVAQDADGIQQTAYEGTFKFRVRTTA